MNNFLIFKALEILYLGLYDRVVRCEFEHRPTMLIAARWVIAKCR